MLSTVHRQRGDVMKLCCSQHDADDFMVLFKSFSFSVALEASDARQTQSHAHSGSREADHKESKRALRQVSRY